MEIRSTVTELLLPVAVFLNVQAFTIADWPDVPRYLLLFALVFGIIAILALIVRLTERAVGRATRVIVVMTGLQTITTILAWMISLILSLELRLEIIHAILAQIFSSIYFGLKLNEFWKRQHHRSDNLGSLDLARQLILLVIANITFMCLSGFLFTYLEGWEFLDSIYFIAVVVTTIGFGDFGELYLSFPFQLIDETRSLMNCLNSPANNLRKSRFTIHRLLWHGNSRSPNLCRSNNRHRKYVKRRRREFRKIHRIVFDIAYITG